MVGDVFELSIVRFWEMLAEVQVAKLVGEEVMVPVRFAFEVDERGESTSGCLGRMTARTLVSGQWLVEIPNPPRLSRSHESTNIACKSAM